MKSKKLIIFLLALVSTTVFANRTLVIKSKVQLDPKEYDHHSFKTLTSGNTHTTMPIIEKIKESLIGIFLTPVETKKDALGSEYKVDAGVRIPIDTTKDWTHEIPNEKIEIKIDWSIKKPIQEWTGGHPINFFSLKDITKTFNYTIPAGKDGETVCLEVSWAGVQACGSK